VSTPLISIVTVSYNAASSIERTLQSVLEQDCPGVEYVVIDGGSTDGTVAIIQRYQSKLAYWHSQPDKGIADAFNQGIANATGRYVGLLNADDWLEPGALRAVVEAFEISKADVVHGHLKHWRNGHLEFTAHGDHTQLWKEMTINHPATFVSRAAYEQYGVFDLSFRVAMDYELLLRMQQGGARFHYLPETLVNMQAEGVSDVRWLEGCREVLRAKLLHGLSGVGARLWFVRQVSAIVGVRLAGKLGLHAALRWWRGRFAKVKKE